MLLHRASRAALLAPAALCFLAATTRAQMPDLVVQLVDDTALVANHQSLAVSGNVLVDVANAGTGGTGVGFDVVVFEDVNGNGTYESGTDDLLGGTATGALGAGMTTTVAVAVAGTLDFRENLLYALADANGDVAEKNEGNNLSNTGLACQVAPVPGTIDPQLEWSWTSSTTEPGAINVMMTPGVVDVSMDGIPDVIFGSTASQGGGGVEVGFLRALSGADGSELFTVTPAGLMVNTTCSVAVGDIDSDGLPEIVASHSVATQLIAFENDGTLKWISDTIEAVQWGGISIADLDGLGDPEIVVGRQALDSSGALLWTGTGGRGYNGSTGPLSLVADVDLDGSPEIVAGNTVYEGDGTILWTAAGVPDGYDATGDFDLDGVPEIVVVTGGTVRLLDNAGTQLWSSAIPGGGGGGPPTVADYDADGVPEIGVAGATRYAVFEGDGTLVWQSVTQDGSSNRTGSSVFDFDGDGSAEVVYRDELFLRVYQGTDGTVLFQTPMSSCTWHEYVLVADVDADGNAEIVACANNNCGFGPQRGIFVYGSASDSWVPTREVWNQHTYHITNVNDDGTIPAVEADNWLTFNNYRQNVLSGLSPLSAPDLTASFIQVDPGDPLKVIARIGNGGSIGVAAGIPVSFYDTAPPSLLGTTATTVPLGPGDYEDVELVLGAPYPAVVCASADDPGDRSSTETECDETNNQHCYPLTPPTFDNACAQTFNLSTGVPFSFTFEASDPDPGELLVMVVPTIPPGATMTPPPPIAGNPVSSVFEWTPAGDQVGTFVVSVEVYDLSGAVATCEITLEVAECFLLVGFVQDETTAPFGGPEDVLLVDPRVVFPVTMVDIPTLRVPNAPGMMAARIYVQVYMNNAHFDPADPVKVSNGLEVRIGGPAVPYGTGSGMQLWLREPPHPGETFRVEFSIDGF